MRKDIQFLRAFAVVAVVIYHLWPDRLPGGFAGVDVFFVISGYLISDHLIREAARDGTVKFGRFYARRARRILPSALIVLALSLLGTLTWTALAEWEIAFRQIFASALFFQNWQLAFDNVDYLTAGAPPSVVQNYWSLAVEEQFYLFWPLLIWLAFMALSRTPRIPVAKLGVLFALVGAASLTFSISFTHDDPVSAFFVTPTRIWEFIAGALISLTIQNKKGTASQWMLIVRFIVAIAGWTAIAVSVALFRAESGFPGGFALLPVSGAAAVIWARANFTHGSTLVSIGENLVLRIAEMSYAIYLFHWPILIFAEQAFDRTLALPQKLFVLTLTLVLSAMSTYLLETPIRFGSFAQTASSRVQITVAALAVGAIAIASFVALAVTKRFTEGQLAEISITVDPSCFGANSRLPTSQCDSAKYTSMVPDPELAFQDKSKVSTGSACGAGEDVAELFSCEFGKPDSAVRVALIGDSHAMAIFPAIEQISINNEWQLTTYLRASCPLMTYVLPGAGQKTNNCNNWNLDLIEELAELEPFDIVVVTATHSNERWSGVSQPEQYFVDAWRPLVESGSQLVVIRDTPGNMDGAIECIAKFPDAPDQCWTDRSVALGYDPLVDAARATPNSYLVDLTPYFCEEHRCSVAIGGVVAYRDAHHLTATFARTLEAPIRLQLEEAGLVPLSASN